MFEENLGERRRAQSLGIVGGERSTEEEEIFHGGLAEEDTGSKNI